MGLLLSGIGSVRQGNFTPDFEIQVLCDIFLIAKCNHMALFVLAVNKGLCATFRTVFVVVAVGGVPCDLTESILADKGHARAGAVVVIVQLDELGGLAVFRQLHQAAVCQIGK